jgi:hypothetical protein
VCVFRPPERFHATKSQNSNSGLPALQTTHAPRGRPAEVGAPSRGLRVPNRAVIKRKHEHQPNIGVATNHIRNLGLAVRVGDHNPAARDMCLRFQGTKLSRRPSSRLRRLAFHLASSGRAVDGRGATLRQGASSGQAHSQLITTKRRQPLAPEKCGADCEGISHPSMTARWWQINMGLCLPGFG